MIKDKRFYVLIFIVITVILSFFAYFNKNRESDNSTSKQYLTATTTVITYKGFSSTIKDLPKQKKWDEVVSLIKESGDISVIEKYKEYYDKDTEWSSRFLISDSISISKLDVDEDVIDETILSLCGLFRSGCSDEIKIIKDSKEIFSTGGEIENGWISKSDTENGFFVNWHSKDQLSSGYCCPTGNMITKFIYKDSKFVPVYEQEVIYNKK